MQELRRHHHAGAVELAAGWIGICATCGWVSREYGNERHAATESARHSANAAECLAPTFRRHGRRSVPPRRGCCQPLRSGS